MSVQMTVLGVDKMKARLEGWAKFQDRMTPVMLRIATDLATHIDKDKLRGQVLHTRSGKLRRSLHPSVYSTSPTELVAMVSNNTEYARIQEYGGTIRPVNRQWLTIPLPAALTPKGVMRYPSARDYPNTFIAKGTIFQDPKKKGGLPVPLFLLRKTSKIPARPYMAPSLREMKQDILARMTQAIQRAMT
jgi:phage gpG-like protein